MRIIYQKKKKGGSNLCDVPMSGIMLRICRTWSNIYRESLSDQEKGELVPISLIHSKLS